MNTFMILIQDASGILDQLAPLLNTIAVWLAVKGVTALKKVAPLWILGILVPGFSALGAWIAGLISPDSNFIVTLLLGFAATFVHEVMKNLNKKAE